VLDKIYLPIDPERSPAALALTNTGIDFARHETYQRLRRTLPSVTIEGVEYRVAEGDLLLDDDELRLYAVQREEDERRLLGQGLLEQAGMAEEVLPSAEDRGLVGMLGKDRRLVRWDDGVTLSYCVQRHTFGEEEKHYQLVVDSMARAAADWESICNVRFKHRQDLDGRTGARPAGVVFVVRDGGNMGRTLATAFFPNSAIARRRLLIGSLYYDHKAHGFDRVGVLRHELGHVLGFRHEHIRDGAPRDCPSESTGNTVHFTDYDRRSVMHYFCAGAGNARLSFTALDRAGARQLYGSPAGVGRESLGAFEPAAGQPADAGSPGVESLFPRPVRVAVVPGLSQDAEPGA
jgi:hypothetical protein